ncbi:hypothetical protein ACTVZO_01635 [Streptomyces sp. IBSNAI002]|uniref:hypothetical protein n=1 Tax=Streptomyces sp. IBSNAI002 TaxID=3457500 RepID=UPI003FD500AA
MARTRMLPVVLLTAGAALAAGSVSLFSSPAVIPTAPRPAATVTVPDDGAGNRQNGFGEVWSTLDGPAVYSIG